MTITVFVPVTGLRVVAGLTNYLLPLPILYSLCLQQAPPLAVVLYLVEQLKPSLLKDLGHQESHLDRTDAVSHWS